MKILNRLIFAAVAALALHGAAAADAQSHIVNPVFIQPETGAVARTFLDKAREGAASVKDFGAKCDDSNDDTAAIQAAVDALGDTSVVSRSGVRLLIPGPCVISSTITIRRKSFILEGYGWGWRKDTNARRPYIRWSGAAGVPMLRVQDSIGGLTIRNLRLIGNTAAKPSAAIGFNETNDGVPNQQITVDTVYIGGFTIDTDPGTHFVNGIAWAGAGVNNAEIRLLGVQINDCAAAAVRQSSTQNLNLTIDHLTVYRCAVGVQVTCGVKGSAWNFALNGVDVYVPLRDDNAQLVNVQIKVHGYYSELAGRMAEFVGTSSTVIHGGFFQLTSRASADGKIVKAEGRDRVALELRQFRFTQASAPATAPFLALRTPVAGAAERSVVIDGVQGWELLTGGTNGLDIATRGPTDRRYIYFRENLQTAATTPLRVSQNILSGVTGEDWNINRFDVPVSVASPAQLTADQASYNPSTAHVWRLSSDAARNISGIAAPGAAKPLTLINVGASKIVLRNENAASAAANRIITGTGADLTLAANQVAQLLYDTVTQRWRVIAKT